MLIGKALAQAIVRLEAAAVDSPRLDAELLMAHVLNANRAQILARPEQSLTPKLLTRYRSLVNRRAEREPLAYLVGSREFFCLDFLVDARVLVPRPETEVLVEHALRLARQAPAEIRIADVGAGSGAIAVTLAVNLPQTTVYALDASADCLDVTAENALYHGVAERVKCLQGDLLVPLPGAVDLITANLPYVTTDEWQALAPEIRTYEPRSALDGGPDGLDAIRSLLASAPPFVRPGGAILLEIGASQGAKVTTLAREFFPGSDVRLYQDYANLDRLVVVKT